MTMPLVFNLVRVVLNLKLAPVTSFRVIVVSSFIYLYFSFRIMLYLF